MAGEGGGARAEGEGEGGAEPARAGCGGREGGVVAGERVEASVFARVLQDIEDRCLRHGLVNQRALNPCPFCFASFTSLW